jgi:hypothetical protein
MRRDTTKKLAKFTISFFLATLMLVGTSVTFSAAQEPTDGQEESSPSVKQKLVNWWEDAPWRFNLNVYGWFPQAPADIKIGKNDVNLPEKFSTIWDDLQFGAMAEFEVHKGPIGVYFAPIYVSLLDREHIYGPLGNRRRNIKLSESVFLCDFGASYEFGPWRLGKNLNSHTVTVEPYAGARYLHDNITIDIDPGSRVTPTIEFMTPVFGLRTSWNLTKRWTLKISGDYGGFNVDDVKTTWQGIGTLAYHFKISNLHTKAFLGYRYLLIDYKKDVELRVSIKGPLVGIGFEF